jgi:hypothetical protein
MKVIVGIFLIICLCSFNYSFRLIGTRNVYNNDSVLISKYQKQLISATGTEKEFLSDLIYTIKKFESKKLDTTISQVAHFESNNQADTVTSRIYEKHDSIYVTYEWRKYGELFWSQTIKNPYTYMGESTLYQYDTRDKWVTFTIGIYQAIPEIENIKGYRDLYMSVENGLETLKSIGITIKLEDYKNYILNYQGDLITYGEPIVRDGMFIWYAPAKRFLLYYHE